MTHAYNVHPIPIPAGEELKGNLYEIVKYNSDMEAVRCDADTDVCIGVVWLGIPSYDTRSNLGRETPIAPLDPSSYIKVKAGGALTAGHLAVPDGANAGRIKGVASPLVLPHGVTAIGTILDAAAAAGEIVRVHPGQITASNQTFRGTWAAGDYAVGDIVLHSADFYQCTAARDSSDTSNPATDTTSWDQISN